MVKKVRSLVKVTKIHRGMFSLPFGQSSIVNL
jgi:hypothetical protein